MKLGPGLAGVLLGEQSCTHGAIMAPIGVEEQPYRGGLVELTAMSVSCSVGAKRQRRKHPSGDSRALPVPSIGADDGSRRTRNHWRSKHRPRMSVPVGVVVSAHRDEVVEAGE
jgi:hypothetical protein